MKDKDVRRMRQKRKLLLKRMGEIEDFVRGSVVLMKRPCTYPACRKCASGERHPTWVLTVSQSGKTRTVYLGKERLSEARRMVKNHRRLKEIVEEIAQINVVLLTGRTLPGRKKTHDKQKGQTRDRPKGKTGAKRGQGP